MNILRRVLAQALAAVLLTSQILVVSIAAQTQIIHPTDRTILPIPQPKPAFITEMDARNSKAPARFEVTAPAGAPNVLVVLIDDMGFGMSDSFGGPIHMPVATRLANNGATV